MFTPSKLPFFFSILAAASLVAAATPLCAVTVQRPFPIGLTHAQTKPYNFTGRTFIFSNTAGGFGSATAIRRHTALTAAHVIFNPTTGFTTRQAFNRGLYEDYTFQRFPVSAVAGLTGYTALASDPTVDFFVASERDLGYLVYTTPPTDEDWAEFNADPPSLNDTPAGSDGVFVLGYPGETFDGATQAYVVPNQPFVELGNGEFENDGYLAEEGMSGGPIYVVRSTGTDEDGNETFTRLVTAETVGGNSSTAFPTSVVRAIDDEAASFLAAAEYSNGLIKKVKVKGPVTVAKGTTQTYTALVKFAVANTATKLAPTTDRYKEIKLISDTVGTPTNPAVTIKKQSNTQFKVTFSPSLRSRSLVTLSAYYGPNQPVPNSSIVVQIQ